MTVVGRQQCVIGQAVDEKIELLAPGVGVLFVLHDAPPTHLSTLVPLTIHHDGKCGDGGFGGNTTILFARAVEVVHVGPDVVCLNVLDDRVGVVFFPRGVDVVTVGQAYCSPSWESVGQR